NDDRALLALAEGALGDLPADGDAGDLELMTAAEVGLHQHAEGVAALLVGQLARGSADAALELEAGHAGAAADSALGHAAAAGAEPGREHRAGGLPAARQEGGHARADGPLADLELPLAGDEGGVADLDTLDVGDGVEGAGSAIEGDAQVAGPGDVRSETEGGG